MELGQEAELIEIESGWTLLFSTEVDMPSACVRTGCKENPCYGALSPFLFSNRTGSAVPLESLKNLKSWSGLDVEVMLDLCKSSCGELWHDRYRHQ